jgi:hypothetical protein
MKRALLCGIAASLIVIGLGRLFDKPTMIDYITLPRAATLAIGFVALLAGIIVIVFARRFPISPSGLVISAGWALGFWVPIVIGGLLLLAAHLAGYPIHRISF